MEKVPIVLTIAGSDSGGGAGIQADLKTFAAFQVYGASAITAVTAQNTRGVFAVENITPIVIGDQIDAIISDIKVNAIKTGMLSNSSIIQIVASKLASSGLDKIVVDPVMVAKGGDLLLEEDAVSTLREVLLPKALVVTPNADEAAVLSGAPVTNLTEAKAAAKIISQMGPNYVVVKGGHFGEIATDILYHDNQFREYTTPRISTNNTHGTGCTFASAIAAGLAWNLSVESSVQQAKNYVFESIKSTFPVGHGHGPLNHFHKWWQNPQSGHSNMPS